MDNPVFRLPIHEYQSTFDILVFRCYNTGIPDSLINRYFDFEYDILVFLHIQTIKEEYYDNLYLDNHCLYTEYSLT